MKQIHETKWMKNSLARVISILAFRRGPRLVSSLQTHCSIDRVIQRIESSVLESCFYSGKNNQLQSAFQCFSSKINSEIFLAACGIDCRLFIQMEAQQKFVSPAWVFYARVFASRMHAFCKYFCIFKFTVDAYEFAFKYT